MNYNIDRSPHRIIDERFNLSSPDYSDDINLYINESMYFLIDNIPEAVLLNDSINIYVELIFREINAGYNSKYDIYSRSVRVKSFISSYRDLSILLAIISALVTIFAV